MFKRLIQWFLNLFKRNVKNTHQQLSTPPNLVKRISSHDERLARYKQSINKKQYPSISDPSYNRKFARMQLSKLNKEEKHSLMLQGLKLDEKGNIKPVQKPYKRDDVKYPSLEAYNQYVKLFNYNNRA